MHIHVERERRVAKFWLDPAKVAYNQGFSPTELNKIVGLVRERQAELLKAWHDYFKSGN